MTIKKIGSRPLGTQLSGAILLTLTVGLGLLLVIVGVQMSAMAYAAFEHEQQTLALIVANTLGGPSPNSQTQSSLQADQQSALAEVARHNASLSIFDIHGNRIASTQNAAAPSADASELRAALRGEMTTLMRDGHFYVAVPIIHDSTIILGAVWLDSSLDSVQAELRNRWLVLLGAALGTLLVTALTARYLAGRIVRPISELSTAAQRMAEGQLATRVTETATVKELALLGSAFNHMATQIENIVARQREFVANASHELRAPLSAIRLRAEMLAAGTLTAEDAKHYATEIDSEAAQLGQFVAELLQLARAEDGTFALPAEAIAPAEVLADCLRAIRPRAALKHQQLHSEIAPDLPDAFISPSDLRSMVGNLLDNAVKYTPDGGQIDLTAGCDSYSNQWMVEVRDTGSGIPPEDLPRVTERFFRVDRAHTRQVPGTGLGLALVLALARRYGGSLEIESSGISGEGTRARLRLNSA